MKCAFLCTTALLFLFAGGLACQESPTPSGATAEKRFPPLQAPADFKATLFACDPFIEYPSVIAAGPRKGTLFVAIDYMTGLGAEIVRRDEVRLLEDTDADGYSDKSTVFASGFNSIQGLTWHDGVVYVMHAPYLTAVRDTKGTGKADDRRDLFSGIGLPPEKDQIRLHNANGVAAGRDGWLYLAVGDRGVNIARPEGDTLVLEGGGILRCRPDGRDLHVFATGLRNIYDVALDDELNVFIRDNENDGGTYKVRVCHSFFGADHGYPYLYDERPEEALPPLADLGLGSSAGGVCYLGTQFPAEYHGNLFFCEWGKALMRYRPERAGSSFAPLKETVFASAAPNDPYGFKPTDVVVGQSGELYVSDWGDGQRPKRGRGRIYQFRYTGSEKPAVADNAMRRVHDVWAIAKLERAVAVEKLFATAQNEDDPRVQAQAIRALADLTDPVLVQHKLAAGAFDPDTAARLAALAVGRDPRVLLETTIALGRLRWAESPVWLTKHVTKPDAALAHATQWTLRRSGNWNAVLQLLDAPSSNPFRAIAKRAAAEQFQTVLVDGLIERLRQEKQPERQRDYADLLARVSKKPGPWEYWGFRPKPRPANTATWERTSAIENALGEALARSDRSVRREILQRMLREQVPVQTAALAGWLETERDPANVAVILSAFGERPVNESRAHLLTVIGIREHSVDNRRKAVSLFLRQLDATGEKSLLTAAETVEDGAVLADVLRAIGQLKLKTAMPVLLAKAKSNSAEVRAAVLDAVAELQSPETADVVLRLLEDKENGVRAAAASAAGKLLLRQTADRLLKLSADSDADVRRACFDSLRRLREPRAVELAVAGLDDPATSLKALELLGELGGPEHRKEVAELARRQPSVETLTLVGKVLAGWMNRKDLDAGRRQELEQALAEIHGYGGQILAWRVTGPSASEKSERLVLVTGLDARVDLGAAKDGDAATLKCAIVAPESATVEFFTSSTGLETVRLNDKVVFQRQRPGIIGPYPDRFEAALVKGTNHVQVDLSKSAAKAQLLFRFRRKSATPEQERFTLAALSRAGNPAHGREIFLNTQKSQCIKCHRVGVQGERVGPELSGLGARFPKVYIVESILQPSRTIAPSYESTTLVLKDGRVLVGVKTAETNAAITLVDNQAKKYEIMRSDVDEQQRSPLSTMPDGLERTLTEDEFVDLVSFLVNLKEAK